MENEDLNTIDGRINNRKRRIKELKEKVNGETDSKKLIKIYSDLIYLTNNLIEYERIKLI